ncbi:hypothetical protein GCM10020256_41170 [Streptomyces thermocoprophilus]
MQAGSDTAGRAAQGAYRVRCALSAAAPAGGLPVRAQRVEELPGLRAEMGRESLARHRGRPVMVSLCHAGASGRL